MSFLAEQVSIGNETIFENYARGFRSTQTKLVLFLRRRETIHAFFKDECRDSFASLCPISNRHRNTSICMYRMRNEVLRTVNRPATIGSDSSRLCSGCIGTRTGFSQSPGAKSLAGGQRNKKFLLLLFGPVLVYMVRAKRIVRSDRDADRAINAGQFLNDRCVFHIAHSGAAVLLRKNNPQETQFGHLRLELNGKMLLFVPFHDVRCNF